MTLSAKACRDARSVRECDEDDAREAEARGWRDADDCDEDSDTAADWRAYDRDIARGLRLGPTAGGGW